jgi:hypothetical protein
MFWAMATEAALNSAAAARAVKMCFFIPVPSGML